ncbi:hypothetical protein SMALA_8443 [Streptomyces malaysiensis subsp. malaysiensis]|nr:hypothetical protein SMALA_8443 [Streptomyces malaysiensis]
MGVTAGLGTVKTPSCTGNRNTTPDTPTGAVTTPISIPTTRPAAPPDAPALPPIPFRNSVDRLHLGPQHAPHLRDPGATLPANHDAQTRQLRRSVTSGCGHTEAASVQVAITVSRDPAPAPAQVSSGLNRARAADVSTLDGPRGRRRCPMPRPGWSGAVSFGLVTSLNC